MRRALQLVLALAVVGLVVAVVTTTREVLGAASPAFAWPSPRGTVFGYPAGFFDLVLYGTIVTAALAGLVAGYRGRGAGRKRHQHFAPAFRPGTRTLIRHLVIACAALFAAAGNAAAQQTNGMLLELRPFVELRPILGGYLTEGAPRGGLHDATLFGLQLAFEVHRRIHLVASVAYVPTEAGRAGVTHDRVDILLYDIGGELNASVRRRGRLTPKPFVGAGFGWRTYRNVDRDAGRTYPGGYVAAGVEYQADVIGLRAEVRDYVSRFAGLAGGERAGLRNDLTLGLGIAYHIR